MELPVPRMVIDEFYIGEPPKLEVFLISKLGKY